MFYVPQNWHVGDKKLFCNGIPTSVSFFFNHVTKKKTQMSTRLKFWAFVRLQPNKTCINPDYKNIVCRKNTMKEFIWWLVLLCRGGMMVYSVDNNVKATSPQNRFGTWDELSIVRIMPNICLCLHSTWIFCCDVPGHDYWEIVPCSCKKERREDSLYSIALLAQNTLMDLENWDWIIHAKVM